MQPRSTHQPFPVLRGFWFWAIFGLILFRPKVQKFFLDCHFYACHKPNYLIHTHANRSRNYFLCVWAIVPTIPL